MKKKSLLMIVTMLTVFLLGISTASYAALGVNDAVPGADVLIPIICEGNANPPAGNPTFGTLDTLWAIAEKNDGPQLPPPLEEYVVCADIFVYNNRSELMLDDKYCWTRYDVVTGNACDLVARMSTSEQVDMEWTDPITGTTFFTGYVEIRGPGDNRFIPWVYLTDLPLGFASGIHGIAVENGLGVRLGELADAAPVSALSIYPRIYHMNDNPETWNWWIILAGRNEYAPLGLPSFERVLDCFLCDEEEDCDSKDIPLPDELNIINIRGEIQQNQIPPDFPLSPIAGFGRCDIVETGQIFPSNQVSIIGTMNEPSIDPVPGVLPYYSLYGWSYQRAQMSTSTLSWDVAHEIHRIYCSDDGSGRVDGIGNAGACSATITP